MIASLRILVELSFPTHTERLWAGSGPYVDGSGNVWRGCVLADEALDAIETAINAEAWTLELGVAGVSRELSDLAWADTDAGDVIGSTVRVLIVECDALDRPLSEPEVKFTGRVDNIRFDDAVLDDRVTSAVIIECTNRFALRSMTNGAVLSDVDQKARSGILNPGADPDRFCERIPGLAQKTIKWPAFN